MTAEELIRHLNLEPHPEEGGWFRETYRADETLPPGALPERYEGERAVKTAIYYLLTPDTFSHLHRLKSDEIFHFYLGDPVEMLHLHPDGSGRRVVLGRDLANGQTLKTVVPHGVWQGARLVPGGRYGLLGCTVAPGFDFADYEHADRAALEAGWPEWTEMIRALTVG